MNTRFTFKKRVLRNVAYGMTLGALVISVSVLYVNYINQAIIVSQHEQTQEIFYSLQGSTQTSFGLYPVVSASLPSEGPNIKFASDLSDVQGIELINNNPAIKEALRAYGFAITPGDYEEFYKLYEENREKNIPNFVTTDAVLHSFHILYDYSLRFAEIDYFSDYLGNFTVYLYNWSCNQYNSISSSNLHEAFKRLTAFFAVPLILLHANKTALALPEEINTLVLHELNNIESQVEGTSPITGVRLDYSQFTVRGHYTRSEQLGWFFKALMYYGLMPFYIDPAYDMIDSTVTNGIILTRMAALTTKGVLSDPTNQTFTAWEHVYEPTTFYVGKADDFSFYEYMKITKDITLQELESDTKINEIITKAKTLPPPLILSAYTTSLDWPDTSKNFRVMGQRFIPDSYFLQNLVHDKVSNRLMPSGLDIMNVLNSTRAFTHEATERQLYPDFGPQVSKLRDEVAQWNDTTWTQNLYFLWLYTLLPLLNEKGPEYASFMRTDAWGDKELMTALGSWAELRHDTILYAKQSTTVLRGGPEPLMKGYVEPNPELYGRLYSLSQLLLDGLSSRGLLPSNSLLYQKVELFSEVMFQLKVISEKELRNEPLTENEIGLICGINNPLEEFVSFDGYDNANEYFSSQDTKSPIIVDIHNDPNTHQVLEVGTGTPNIIYVIVPDENGEPLLTVGATYSYYEFTQDMTHRLTDEEWWNMLESGIAPLPPAWILQLIVQDE